MAVIESWFDQDLMKPIQVRNLGNIFNQDSLGNLIGVRVKKNGEDFTLSGSVTGFCILPNGETVPVPGYRQGNKAYIVLIQNCYDINGPVAIAIKLTDGDTIVTLAACVGIVTRSITDNMITPSQSVIDNWASQIDTLLQNVQDAADNVGAIVATPYEDLTYPVPLGKYTYYNDNLYKCVSPIPTSEEFTPAHWSSDINLGDEVNSLKDNPVFTGSVSMGRAENSTVGITSTALGYDVTASGDNSHAEGMSSSATSEEAHAEGLHTTASGNWSHSEGSYTTASGSGSHAEGKATIANHLAQHVFGTFNVADTSTASSDQRGNYIEIVGNGAIAAERSNARTLDWNGNETLSGDLTVGKGTNNETSVIALKSAIIQEIDIGDPYETAGLISGQTGGFSANEYFTASEYIDISDYAGIKINITCSLYNASGYAFYNSGKTFIADSGYYGTAHGSNVFGTFEATVPSNAKYVRFSLFNFDASFSSCGISVSIIDDKLALKLNKPSTNGTNGQILQSNGDETTSWVDFSAETDKTLSIENKAADAKAVGDFIFEQINIGSGVAKVMINGDNGVIGSNDYFVGSDWIDVSAYAGSKIIVKCGFYNAIGLAFYTRQSGSTFIPGSGVSGNTLGENALKSVLVAVPATAVYLRFSIINTQGTYTDCSVTVSKIATISGEIGKLTYAKDYERRLVLCPQIRMAEGIEYSFHYDNMVRGFRPADADILADQYLAGYDGYAKITPDSSNSLHNYIFSQNGLNTYLNCKFVEPDMGNLSKAFKKFAVAADAGDGKSLKGIFIGDSFTQAGKYVKYLIETCAENGITLTSLGTMSTTVGGTAVTQEGRGGWRAYDYANSASKTVGGVTLSNPFFNDGGFDFSYYMTQQGYSGLDFVAVFLGVNDVIGSTNTSDEDILDSLTAIITSIRAYSNSLPIYLWLPPSRCIAPTNRTKRRYYLPNASLVDADAALRYNCLVVDNFSDVSGVEIIPVGWNVDPIYDYNITEGNRNTENTTSKEWHVTDAIHPSDTGYKHIADVVYGTMLYLASNKS